MRLSGSRLGHLHEQPVDDLRQIDPPDNGARLEGVVGERIHDAGASDGDDPGRRPVGADVGDDHGIARAGGPQQAGEPHADERRQIAARDLRRAVDRAILRRQPRDVGPGPHDFQLRFQLGVRLDRERGGERLGRALEVAAGFEHLSDLDARCRVAGLERDRLGEMLQRAIVLALLPFDRGQLAIQERAVGRALDGAGVERDGLLEPSGERRGARAVQILLLRAKPHHLDAPRHVAERRIDDERRLERRQRVGFPVQRQQRSPAAEQRRQMSSFPARGPGRNAAARPSRPRAPARRSRGPPRPGRSRVSASAPTSNSRSAFFKSPACSNCQPRSWLAADGLPASDAGTAGARKSGNFGGRGRDRGRRNRLRRAGGNGRQERDKRESPHDADFTSPWLSTRLARLRGMSATIETRPSRVSCSRTRPCR